MLPDIESLQCFDAAAAHLNFRAAARSVHLSPGAFGESIKKLETDLELSILLALEAVKRANIKILSEGTIGIDEAKREAQHALHQAAHARRIRRTINGHTQAVNCVTYSPDGKRIVTASQDGTSKIWDVASNEMLLLSGHTDSIICLLYTSPSPRDS